MSLVTYADRKNTNSSKWDGQAKLFGEENLHAMWVADMDFKAPDCVVKALADYVNQGVFGYFKIPDSYYSAFIDWEEKQHSWKVEKEWLRFSPGVVCALNWMIQILTQPSDAVLIQTPVYFPFSNSVQNNGRKLVTSVLNNENGKYTINFEDFEQKILDNHVTLFVLCSPHNPVGRVWTKDELTRLMDICRRHQVKVISDEIHHDLVFENHMHTPAALTGDYNDMLVTLTAPSKTFNLASCQNSVIIIPDEDIRRQWDTYISQIRVTDGNSFGYIAAEAAYTSGYPWLLEVKKIILGNYQYLKDALTQALPGLIISPMEGTYLAWLDFRNYVKPQDMKKFIQEQCRLALDYGDWFGGDDFASCVRMNLATSRENVEIAVEAMIQTLSND